MSGTALFSTAYLPPSEYFFRMARLSEAAVELEENYIKQTYRNRFYILSPNGINSFTVPVLLGSFHKTPVRDIRIDYSKRWQQVHLRALNAAYANSPFYLYYIDGIRSAIEKDHTFLTDLNTELTQYIISLLGLKVSLSATTVFTRPGEAQYDYRYSISPKVLSAYSTKPYTPVFETGNTHDPRLSIVDLLFSEGPGALSYLGL